MSIIPNSFRKQKKYITDENGDHELVSTWTSTDTVETTDGETLTDYLDSHVDVTIDVTTPSEVAKRYTFTQNDTVIGVVDIPLDMVVSAATVETVVTPDVPYEGAEVGDKYIDMVIANSSEDHIYIPCKDIISDDSVDKVKQSPSTTNSNYEILFSGTADNTERTETTKKSNKLLYNPGSNQLRVSDNDNYVGIAEENIYIEHNSMDSSNMYVTLHDLRQGQRASVTPDHINVEQYDLDTHDSSILTMTHDDIELTDTWDGTNTSLKDAIADCGGGTDENVEQSNNTTNADYRVLLSHSANDTTETAGTYKSAGLRYNPSKNALTMGSNNTTSGNNSIAEGSYTTASGDNSHSEGYGSVASGDESHAEGVATASGNYSHAEGSGVASGVMSHTEGYQTIANHSSQHVFGECNVPDDSSASSTERGNYVEIVGNGASTSQRSNARTLDWSGNEVLAGKLTVGVAPTNDMDVATKKYVDDNAGTSTDEKVKQMDSSTSSSFRLLLSNSANDTTETAEVKKNATLTYNPGTQSLKVAKNNNANQHTTIQSGGTITTNDPLHVAGSQNYLVDEYGNRKESLDHNIDYYRSNNSQQFNGQIEASASYSEDDASGISINVDMELTPNTFDPKLSFEKQVTDLGEGTTTTKTVEYGVEDITLSETWDGTHTSLKDAIANAGGGTTVVANPTGTATDELTSIQIGEDIYEIVGSGGGGNAELQKTVLLSTPITTTGTYTLADDYTNYDFIAIQAGNGSTEVDIHTYTADEITTAMTNNLTITNPNTGGWFNFTMNANEIIIPGMQISTINSVVGYKIIGGGGGTNVIEKTQAQYNALTQAEKENGSIYMVQDSSALLIELTEPQTSTSTKVTASSYMVDTYLRQYHYPWAAFNRVSPTTWEYPTPGVTSGTAWTPDISRDGSNSWIQYYFETPVKMAMMTVWAFADYSGSTTKSFIIEGSNDGTSWTNILASGDSCSLTASLHQNYINEIPLNAEDSYAYVRLRSLEPMGASYQPTIFIDEIFVYGYGKPVNRIYYMDTEYANTEVSGSGSNVVEHTQTEYNALTQAEKENGSVYMVTSGQSLDLNYSYYTANNDTIIVRVYHEGLGDEKIIWFFRGWNQSSGDTSIPSNLTNYAPSSTSAMYSGNYPNGGTTQDGWIGFYNGQIRAWTQDLSDTTTGIMYGVVDTSRSGEQTNPYVDDPYVYLEASNKIYYMGTEYANTNSGSGSGDSYSTTEQVVGTWIDGRPLYQKTYYYPNSWTSTDRIILDSTFLPSVYDNFFETDIHFTVNNDYINGNGQMGSSGMEVFSGSSLGGLGLVNGVDSVTITNLYLTIRYTKVADL